MDEDVEAVGREVLPERDTPGMEDPPEPGVAMEAPTGLEVAEETDGIGDRRLLRRRHMVLTRVQPGLERLRFTGDFHRRRKAFCAARHAGEDARAGGDGRWTSDHSKVQRSGGDPSTVPVRKAIRSLANERHGRRSGERRLEAGSR
jgi:hypothetical protein